MSSATGSAESPARVRPPSSADEPDDLDGSSTRSGKRFRSSSHASDGHNRKDKADRILDDVTKLVDSCGKLHLPRFKSTVDGIYDAHISCNKARPLRLAFFGQGSRGKSFILNSLLHPHGNGLYPLPSRSDSSVTGVTAVPIVVIPVSNRSGGPEINALKESDSGTCWERIPYSTADDVTTTLTLLGRNKSIREIELKWPSQSDIVDLNVHFIDLPGKISDATASDNVDVLKSYIGEDKKDRADVVVCVLRDIRGVFPEDAMKDLLQCGFFAPCVERIPPGLVFLVNQTVTVNAEHSMQTDFALSETNAENPERDSNTIAEIVKRQLPAVFAIETEQEDTSPDNPIEGTAKADANIVRILRSLPDRERIYNFLQDNIFPASFDRSNGFSLISQLRTASTDYRYTLLAKSGTAALEKITHEITKTKLAVRKYASSASTGASRDRSLFETMVRAGERIFNELDSNANVAALKGFVDECLAQVAEAVFSDDVLGASADTTFESDELAELLVTTSDSLRIMLGEFISDFVARLEKLMKELLHAFYQTVTKTFHGKEGVVDVFLEEYNNMCDDWRWPDMRDENITNSTTTDDETSKSRDDGFSTYKADLLDLLNRAVEQLVEVGALARFADLDIDDVNKKTAAPLQQLRERWLATVRGMPITLRTRLPPRAGAGESEPRVSIKLQHESGRDTKTPLAIFFRKLNESVKTQCALLLLHEKDVDLAARQDIIQVKNELVAIENVATKTINRGRRNRRTQTGMPLLDCDTLRFPFPGMLRKPAKNNDRYFQRPLYQDPYEGHDFDSLKRCYESEHSPRFKLPIDGFNQFHYIEMDIVDSKVILAKFASKEGLFADLAPFMNPALLTDKHAVQPIFVPTVLRYLKGGEVYDPTFYFDLPTSDKSILQVAHFLVMDASNDAEWNALLDVVVRSYQMNAPKEAATGAKFVYIIVRIIKTGSNTDLIINIGRKRTVTKLLAESILKLPFWWFIDDDIEYFVEHGRAGVEVRCTMARALKFSEQVLFDERRKGVTNVTAPDLRERISSILRNPHLDNWVRLYTFMFLSARTDPDLLQGLEHVEHWVHTIVRGYLLKEMGSQSEPKVTVQLIDTNLNLIASEVNAIAGSWPLRVAQIGLYGIATSYFDIRDELKDIRHYSHDNRLTRYQVVLFSTEASRGVNYMSIDHFFNNVKPQASGKEQQSKADIANTGYRHEDAVITERLATKGKGGFLVIRFGYKDFQKQFLRSAVDAIETVELGLGKKRGKR